MLFSVDLNVDFKKVTQIENYNNKRKGETLRYISKIQEWKILFSSQDVLEVMGVTHCTE